MVKKPVAIFDIDGTFFRWQLFHELVFQLKDMGCFSKEIAKKLDETFLKWQGLQATWSEYEDQVVKAIEDSITSISPKKVEQAAQNIINKSGHEVYAFTAQLAQKLKKEGYFLLAITGSQQEIAELFAKKHGFDDCIGLIHERKNDRYTGKYERFIVNKKLFLAKQYIDKHNLSLEESYGIGDSASDIDILHLVTHPIAFNPSKELLDEAQARKWPIVIERKNIMYKMEMSEDGYKLAETRILEATFR